jgi:hypothetical protein
MSSFIRALENPNESAKPRVWWHWMNGNIDSAGISKDLDWMQRIGIGGVQIFEGGMGAPQVVEQRVVYRSEEWYELFSQALRQAKSKSIEVSIASSAGWSVMGAEWVRPEDAMKKLVWSETVISGSAATQLAELPSCEGPFQDAPVWGRPQKHNWARDFKILAVEESPKFHPLKPTQITFSREATGDLNCLFDGSFASWVSLEKDVANSDSVWCVYEFAEPVFVGSATIGVSGPNGFGAPELPDAFLEFSHDGTNFESLATFPMMKSMGQLGEIAAKTISFESVTARYFRLRLATIPMADALPPFMQGVSPLPFKPKDFDKFLISEFALFTGGRVHAFEFKAGFSIAQNYFELEAPIPGEAAIEPTSIIDLTKNFDSSTGALNFDCAGKTYRVFRIGYSLTGHENGPAPAEATGLEIDKLDKKRIAEYLENFYQPLLESLEARGFDSSFIGGILSDSIESRAQNFSESLPEEFESRRGYSMLPWLLAMTGWVVDSVQSSDRFLYDLRLTISELVAECMYRLISEFAHGKSARYYSEALESHRPQLGDDLQMRSYADVPMGAMWTWPEVGAPMQTYIADLKGASSVAHVYGKTHTGCESFSTFARPFVYSPSTLKPVADLELTLGVTVFNIHSSPHQPDNVGGPGVTLAPTLGQVFTRNETWSESAKPWVDYLTRSCAALNIGSPVAQLLYFIGEEAPVTAIWGDREFEVPSGYDFDLVSKPGLLTQISVTDGKLASAQGNYDLLYLGGNSEKLTLETIQKLIDLAAAGVPIFGSLPTSSPSLSDDQNEFQSLVEALAASDNFYSVNTEAAAIALAEQLGITRADWRFKVGDKELDASYTPRADIRCIHRADCDSDLYFVSNTALENLELSATFSAQRNYAYLIDSASPEKIFELEESNDEFQIKLGPYASVFVLLCDSPVEHASTMPVNRSEDVISSWVAKFDDLEIESGATFDWSTSSVESIRYHSGSAKFKTSIQLEQAHEAKYALGFDDFSAVIDVFVNNNFAGTVWAFGQEIDISDYVRPGQNDVELVVKNNWRNRLIGDQYGKTRLASSAPTYLGYPIFDPDAELMPAGLLAPVKIVVR